MLYAYLSVHSETLTLTELEVTLGRSDLRGDHADVGIGGHSVGDPSPQPGGRPMPRSCWERAVVLPSDGLEGVNFETRVAELAPELADAVRVLVDAGAWASLVVVQEVHASRGDNDDKGLCLGPDALAWLARAGVTLDVDQYVHTLEWWQSLARSMHGKASDAFWSVRARFSRRAPACAGDSRDAD